jgi:exodeoxyribonuclease V beta subunit
LSTTWRQEADVSSEAFPGGAKAGTMIHEIFQALDFSSATPDLINTLTGDRLRAHGYAPGWRPAVAALVTNTVTTPLAGRSGTFTLSSLRPGDWLTELEFFLPLGFVTSQELRDTAEQLGALLTPAMTTTLANLRFQPLKGLVRGFMDMVFLHDGRYYLVDWKSNWLGNTAADYAQQQLAREMTRQGYPLQYLLYTVALDRYLSGRLPGYCYEEHFGGVFYLFLRGMAGPQGGDEGIYFDLPDPKVIAAFSRQLSTMTTESSYHV